MKICKYCNRYIYENHRPKPNRDSSITSSYIQMETVWIHHGVWQQSCMNKNFQSRPAMPNEEKFTVWGEKEIPWYRENNKGALKIIGYPQEIRNYNGDYFNWHRKETIKAWKKYYESGKVYRLCCEM